MLLALSLRDFVIVENLNLDFQNGFTVLTGETGAGKSITLDAIGLLLGDKADYSQVRSGAKEAQLSALFDISGLPELKAQLQEQGLLEEDAEELSIRRIIDAKGKSRSYINNQVATLAQLKAIGEQLIDIHGQKCPSFVESRVCATRVVRRICWQQRAGRNGQTALSKLGQCEKSPARSARAGRNHGHRTRAFGMAV